MFICGETLFSIAPRKIPGWIVLVHDIRFSVNNGTYKKSSRSKNSKQIQILQLAFTPFIYKKVENNSRFLNWRAEENLVMNNKDNRTFMSRNYQSDGCPFEI